MIAFPSEFPSVLWHGGRPIPLTAEWIIASLDMTARQSGTENWVWSGEVAAAIRLYFRDDYEYATINPSELVDVFRQILIAVGKEEMARMAMLAPPRTTIFLPELARRAGMEMAFYNLLREQIRDLIDGSVRSIQLHGMRDCVKSLSGVRRWKDSCSTLSRQIEEYARACAEKSPTGPVELLFEP